MINFNNIIESVGDAPNRFSTLKELYPVTVDGQPKLRAGRNYCDIEMSDGKRRYCLRCFTRKDKAVTGCLPDLSTFFSAIDEPVYGSFSFHEDELLIFDDNGGYLYADVVLWEKAEGTPLSDFAENCLSGKVSGGEDALKELIDQLAAFAGRHFVHRIDIGGVTHHNLTVSPVGGLQLGGFESASRCESPRDIAGMAVIFTILYLSFSDRRLLGYLHHSAFSGQCIDLFGKCSAAEELPVHFRELCAAITAVAGQYEINRENIEKLLRLMRQATEAGVARIENLSVSKTVTAEECVKTAAPLPVKYEFVGEPSCMMMRAFDGERWCYLDHNGRLAIPGPFIEAYDFWEGLAVVEVDYGRFGVIDRDGNFVIEPVYDEMEYDQTGNRYIVSSNGLSALLTRTGEKVTEFIYDNILTEREGFYIVQKNGKCGYITRNGEPVTEIIYEEASAFRNGVGRVTLRGREYLIGTDGVIIEEIIKE